MSAFYPVLVHQLAVFSQPSFPRSVALPQLASDGGFFIFMFWYFHRGLEPHLQRAHAGHTQVGDGDAEEAVCLILCVQAGAPFL
jgi:hypothetical protein